MPVLNIAISTGIIACNENCRKAVFYYQKKRILIFFFRRQRSSHLLVVCFIAVKHTGNTWEDFYRPAANQCLLPAELISTMAASGSENSPDSVIGNGRLQRTTSDIKVHYLQSSIRNFYTRSHLISLLPVLQI